MKTWIKDKRLDIDLVEELSEFSWERERVFDDKFVACSPFRYDNSPSFFVNLENLPDKEIAGTWLDSGALEGSEWRSGTFLKLLAFLREETEEETYDYLVEKYDFKPYTSKLEIKPSFKMKKEFKPLSLPVGLIDIDYLPSRGIPFEVCVDVGIVFVDEDKSVAFPWRNPIGEVQAIKYRRTEDKIFYYEKGGRRLNELLFNIDWVVRNRCKTIAITEAEIDALSWLAIGRGAVAVGGSSFSPSQLSQLIRTGAENLIISTDNDKVGKGLANRIIKMAGKYFNIFQVVFPEGVKDMNEFIVKYPNQRPKIVKINSKIKL